jgi:hypothetical protein
MKEIFLTQNQVAIVDDEDFDRVNKFKWCARWNRNEKSFVAMRGVTQNTKILNPYILMHRFIVGARKGMFVDHINHDTLDNRKQNLRVCTNSENCMNRNIEIRNTSGYKGVSFNKVSNKWIAYIKKNQKQVYLGRFENKKDAAIAYNERAIIEHGKFALINKL